MSEHRRPIQFRLRTLLLVVAGWAILLSIVVPLLQWMRLLPPQQWFDRASGLCLALGGLTLTAIHSYYRARHCARCAASSEECECDDTFTSEFLFGFALCVGPGLLVSFGVLTVAFGLLEFLAHRWVWLLVGMAGTYALSLPMRLVLVWLMRQRSPAKSDQ